jgi:hypothetical protein
MATATMQEGRRRSRRPAGSRRAYWRRVVEDCRRSGLRQVEFCRRRGIAPGTLGFWKFTLAREGARHAATLTRRAPAPAFVPVRVVPAVGAVGGARPADPAAPPEVEIALSGGRLVRVRGRVEAQWLGQVLRALEAPGC